MDASARAALRDICLATRQHHVTSKLTASQSLPAMRRCATAFTLHFSTSGKSPLSLLECLVQSLIHVCMCNPHTVVPEEVLPSSTCCNTPKPAPLQIDVNCRTIALTEPETHIEKSILRMAEKGMSPKEFHMKTGNSATSLWDWPAGLLGGVLPPRSLQNDTLSILLKLNSQLRIGPGWIYVHQSLHKCGNA